MEYAHAKAICDKALKLGRPSVALTQAIHRDTALRRIQVMGSGYRCRPAILVASFAARLSGAA